MIEQKKYNSDFFDSAYFLDGTKSNYFGDFFDWEKRKNTFIAEAGRMIQRFKPKKVLDIGCALGFFVQGFNECGIEAHGVDISEWAIKHAKPNCQVVDICEQKLPFEDNYFDLVTCYDILEHIPVQFHEFVFSEINRVCSKTLYIHQPFLVMPEQVYGKPEDDISHVALMPPYYYNLTFTKLGFNLEEMSPTEKNPWDLRLVFSK